MNETQNDEIEKTADGDPLVDRGIADSANATVTDPDEDGDDEADDNDDGDDEEDEEDLGL